MMHLHATQYSCPRHLTPHLRHGHRRNRPCRCHRGTSPPPPRRPRSTTCCLRTRSWTKTRTYSTSCWTRSCKVGQQQPRRPPPLLGPLRAEGGWRGPRPRQPPTPLLRDLRRRCHHLHRRLASRSQPLPTHRLLWGRMVIHRRHRCAHACGSWAVATNAALQQLPSEYGRTSPCWGRTAPRARGSCEFSKK